MELRPPLAPANLAIRSLIAGFAAGGAMLAGAGWVAQAQGISAFNSNQPVNYSADRIVSDLNARTVTLDGHARLRMTPGRMRMP